MSSPEVERFEITDEDLLNEFNPNRPQFRLSKNKAIYGMWAEDSDDEESGPRRHKKDFTAPIGFVSGGVKVGDTVTKSKEGVQSDSDSDNDAPGSPTLITPRQRKTKGYVPGGKHQEHSFGGWEKHTKGFGQKMLEKFGHVPGKGLGKNSQGISTPVEAMKRPGRAAVGSYGTERTERSLQDFPRKEDSDEEEKKEFERQLQQWKKGDNKQPKKRFQYKTAEELLKEGFDKRRKVAKDNTSMSKVKVIDMTGKEQRVLSGYHAIGHKHEIPEEEIPARPQAQAFDMPELIHNLDILVNLAEEDIIKNDSRLKHERDLGVNLQFEKQRMDELCDKEEKQINRLQDLLTELDRWQQQADIPGFGPTITDCSEFLKRLQQDFYEEYRMYDLWSLCIVVAFPLFKKLYEGWDPLQERGRGLSVLKEWQVIFRQPINQPLHSEEAVMEPYERLIWEVWAPPVRRAIANDWTVRHPQAVVDFLEAWQALLPPWVLSNLLEILVFPRLQAEVESWNPLTDTVPIHAWLIPWLPLLKDRLEPLFTPIRQKLAAALVNWHPSDPSARLILQPWKGVWRPGYMEAFLVKNIVPKLKVAMSSLVINPHQQHLDNWKWVMAWIDMVPKQHMVQILLQHFLPQWMQTLVTWLNSSPDYEEIRRWYMGWKSMIPEQLASDRAVQEEMKKAIILLDRQLTDRFEGYPNTSLPSVPLPPPPPPPPPPPAEFGPSNRRTVPTTLKGIVESMAEESGILFTPVFGRTYEAKQVFKLGRVHVYFDRNVAFVQLNSGQWQPSGVTELLDRAA